MNKISEWIKQYCEKYDIKSLIVGVSGGIDSALTSKLCALTEIETVLLTMPIHQGTDQYLRALKHIEWLKDNHSSVSHRDINLTSLYETFVSELEDIEKDTLALANTKARLRMTMLYQIAQVRGGIVVGTGNKVEDFGIGFFTKYGDGGVDISPIADLTKTEVREMAKELGVCEEILVAQPTDGLWDDGRTDEDQIGATYEELEWAMEYLGRFNMFRPSTDGYDLTDRQKEVVEIYSRFHNKNKHKMVPIPVYTKGLS